MRVTIKDIAKKAGVSITTVSRVVNDKLGGISQETRERVLKIVEEMNYQPNALARSLVTKQTLTLGLILPNISNPFFPEMVRGVEDIANQNGYSVIICNTDDVEDKEKNYIHLLKEKYVDGIIFSSNSRYSGEHYDILHKANIPFVLIDRGEEGGEGPYHGVFIDNEKGGYLATQHLIDLGHKKIACMTGPIELGTAKRRLLGYQKALYEAKLPIKSNWIIQGNFRMKTAYLAAKTLLIDEEITAIFACNDLMACGIYQAAYELGRRIPDDLSVIGFDDIQLVEALTPKLTTIRQSSYTLGKTAAEIMIQDIKKVKSDKRIVKLDPRLVLRNSTKGIK
jgi:LacI family transcriptional regulator